MYIDTLRGFGPKSLTCVRVEDNVCADTVATQTNRANAESSMMEKRDWNTLSVGVNTSPFLYPLALELANADL